MTILKYIKDDRDSKTSFQYYYDESYYTLKSIQKNHVSLWFNEPDVKCMWKYDTRVLQTTDQGI